MERRELVRSIAAHLPVAGAGEECRLVASDWLTTWANAPPTEAVPAIDNSELVCQHGRLDPAAWSSAKRVSLVGWTELHARHGGGPEVGPNDLCEECTRQALVEIVAKCASLCWVLPHAQSGGMLRACQCVLRMGGRGHGAYPGSEASPHGPAIRK